MMQLKVMRNTKMNLINSPIKDLGFTKLSENTSSGLLSFFGGSAIKEIEKNREDKNRDEFLHKYAIFFNNLTEKLNTKKDANFEKRIFNEFKKNYDKFKIFHDVNFDDIKFYSFLNFLRYYNYLFFYFENFSFYTTFGKGLVSIVFKSNQKTLISLQLTFQTNGITRFLSQDQDCSNLESQTYIIEGNFSSSNLLSKNYKIERLMRILTSELKHEFKVRAVIVNLEHNEIVSKTKIFQLDDVRTFEVCFG